MCSRTAGLLLAISTGAAAAAPLPRVRPPVGQRTFRSPAVERLLERLTNRTWRDPDLGTLLWNCLPNTLDTTVRRAALGPLGAEDTFVITGDIPAMWLRDSANQVSPYARLAKEEPDGIGALLRGVIRRHVASILIDPYAQAFVLLNASAPPPHHADDDTTRLAASGRVNAMTMGVYERKFELDSLLSALRLSRLYWNNTNDTSPFDGRWRQAVRAILQTLRAMQRPLAPRNISEAPYTFQRQAAEPKDTLAHGIGRAHRYTGMVRTAFLPSDDAAKFSFHIPGNAMAVVELRGAAAMLKQLRAARRRGGGAAGDIDLATDLASLADEVDAGIRTHGVVRHASGVQVFAMEVDGFGNFFFGDDANVPSLLSLPYLGYVPASDALYRATRALLLSNATNPYFWGPGQYGLEGIGSEDASGQPGWGHVWPISLMVRALTATDDAEIAKLLADLKVTSAGTGLMHESFWYEDVSQYTREWFAWANSLLGELLLRMADERPHLLFTASPGSALA